MQASKTHLWSRDFNIRSMIKDTIPVKRVFINYRLVMGFKYRGWGQILRVGWGGGGAEFKYCFSLA